MNTLLTFTWDMPLGLDLGILTLRFYSLLFAGGFVLGYFVMKKIFTREGLSEKQLDSLVTYAVIGTVVGARLGHVFFYQWDYYRLHPGEIIKVWEGGLASHGAAIALIIAMVVYAKKVIHKSPLWILDRLVITVALAAVLIRVGNFFNSEIYGAIENSPFETVYVSPPLRYLESDFNKYIDAVDIESTGEQHATDSLTYPIYTLTIALSDNFPNRATAERFLTNQLPRYLRSMKKENTNILPHTQDIKWLSDGKASLSVLGVPRNPTQIYEALGYLLIFLILYNLYWRSTYGQRRGFLFGTFLTLLFGFRFFIEYFKEVQVSAEVGQVLNIGQKLSIPLVIAGLLFILLSLKRKK